VRRQSSVANQVATDQVTEGRKMEWPPYSAAISVIYDKSQCTGSPNVKAARVIDKADQEG
jgi:hypothetical protein